MTALHHPQSWRRLCLLVCLALMLAGAAHGDASTQSVGPAYAVLLIGNSHSSRSELQDTLARVLAAGLEGATVVVERAPGWAFLADRLDDEATIRAFQSTSWTHVVLQAQKYSSSGKYRYPTAGTEEWIRRTRAIGAVPILFPEWARRGHDEEALRVHRLHESIAAREAACVAPVGLAWEVARDNRPGMILHAQDGNHANRRGALLAAYVLYEAITGQRAVDLPVLDSVGVDAPDQAYLRQVASSLSARMPACKKAHLRTGEGEPGESGS